MTDVMTLFNTAIVNKLKANGSLAAMVGGTTNPRIWENHAPDGVTGDYVIFQRQWGGDSNTSPRRDVDSVFSITMWSTSVANARTGAGYIEDALNGQELTISGWSNYRMETVQQVSQDELVNGQWWYRRGGWYRISADLNG